MLQQHVSLDILPNTWHARSGGSEMKQDRHRVCCFVGKRGRGWGCPWERGSTYSHHGWALRRRADPCALAPLEQGAGQPRERGQSCCVPGIRAPGGELGPEPWSREGAAWGLGWGREELLLLPCGKEHREEEGRRRAPRWCAASRWGASGGRRWEKRQPVGGARLRDFLGAMAAGLASCAVVGRTERKKRWGRKWRTPWGWGWASMAGARLGKEMAGSVGRRKR